MNFSLKAKKSILSFGLLLLLLPFFVSAQAGIQGSNTGTYSPPSAWSKITGVVWDCQVEDPTKKPGECNFDDFLNAVKRVTNIGVIFALGFSVVVIAIAGGRYMISGDKSGERDRANKMLLSVAKGIAFMLLAWLIVTLIVNALGVNAPKFLG